MTPSESKAKELEREVQDLAYYAGAAIEHGKYELAGDGRVDLIPSADGGVPVGD